MKKLSALHGHELQRVIVDARPFKARIKSAYTNRVFTFPEPDTPATIKTARRLLRARVDK